MHGGGGKEGEGATGWVMAHQEFGDGGPVWGELVHPEFTMRRQYVRVLLLDEISMKR